MELFPRRPRWATFAGSHLPLDGPATRAAAVALPPVQMISGGFLSRSPASGASGRSGVGKSAAPGERDREFLQGVERKHQRRAPRGTQRGISGSALSATSVLVTRSPMRRVSRPESSLGAAPTQEPAADRKIGSRLARGRHCLARRWANCFSRPRLRSAAQKPAAERRIGPRFAAAIMRRASAPCEPQEFSEPMNATKPTKNS